MTQNSQKRAKKAEAIEKTKQEQQQAKANATVEETVKIVLAEQKKKSENPRKRKRQDTDCEFRPQVSDTWLTCESKISEKTQNQPQACIQETQDPRKRSSQDQKEGSRKERQRRKIQEEISRLLDDKSDKFDVNRNHTYPDSFLEVSEQSRLMFVTYHTDVQVLDTLRSFKPGVHKQPGIEMPGSIEYFLSLNLKYLFHQSANYSLPMQAFKLLARSIRIKWMMRNKIDKGFNPKFYVKSAAFQPPKAHAIIENGIRRGREELLRQIDPATPPAHGHRDHVNPGTVKRFMTENKLLACITDKNLGIAVVTKEWYHEQIMEHLGDTQTYKPVQEVPVDEIYECLNEVFEVSPECFTADMANFVTFSETDYVPEFYGIPKIHKNPWKLRPIVPNVKWVTNNAAKVVDFHLQPLLKKFPWILSSTRQFCKMVDELPKGTQLEISTGDVRSMYTNIPRKELRERISKLLERFPDTYPVLLRMALMRLIELVNDACFFQYQGQHYWQRRGLAMGVACAPVLAQLYLGVIEEQRMEYARKRGVLFYGRYIDDIITILPATTKLSTVAYVCKDDHLDITWTDRTTKIPFLDTEVFISGERVLTKVFQKQLNHYQYIPWSSAHPKNVKKAFVKGELVRHKVICSRTEDFQEASRNLFDHLRARGYPTKLLAAWMSMVKPGEDRFGLTPKSKELPWMLPSHYNPAWDLVHVKGIQKAMVEEWSKGVDFRIPEFSGKRLITSFKRTVSLEDQVRAWNKIVLMD